MPDPDPRYVEVQITPSLEQYREMMRDLALLRERGADSNTQAVLDAVHAAAQAEAA